MHKRPQSDPGTAPYLTPTETSALPPQRQSCAAIVFPFDILLFLTHKVSTTHISALHRHVSETTSGGYNIIIRLKAFTPTEEQWYTISVLDKTCDCHQFDITNRCEHLSALGLYRLKPFTPSAHPTFSQGLSGLVKSLRIRRLEEAVYWLVYLDTFKEPAYRFRTARRLLIGSAEDGHSIAVMEKMRERFGTLNKPQAQLIDLVREAVRICKLPNWWHPDSGGPDYVYRSMVGQRRWWYRSWDHTAATLLREIQIAVEQKDPAMALGGVMAFADVRETFGATKQAEYLLRLAQSIRHDLAGRLCKIHLSAKSALSGDNNFLCQAIWMMGGGVSPIAETILPVTAAECGELLDKARERWKNPQPIPRWCCDGVHSAGSDTRFMGSFDQMIQVVNAFQHYGRIDPSDEWLPSFKCYDGLIIEGHDDAAGRA